VTSIGWLGVWLLVLAGAAILIELAVMGVWTGRLARRGRAVALQLEAQRSLLQADVERLRLLVEETQRLWEPYARVLRWLQHPLVVALLASLQRRWAAG